MEFEYKTITQSYQQATETLVASTMSIAYYKRPLAIQGTLKVVQEIEGNTVFPSYSLHIYHCKAWLLSPGS